MSDYKFRCVRCQQEVNSGASMCPWCHADPFSGHDPSPLPSAAATDGTDGCSFFLFFGGLLYLFSWNWWTEYFGLGMLAVSVLLLIRHLNRLRND